MRSLFAVLLFYCLKCSPIFGCFQQSNSFSDNQEDDTKSVAASNGIEDFIRLNSNSNWAEELSFKQEVFPFTDDILYIMAFNVGQANCIILRKARNVVIVDAGGTFADENVSSKAINLISGCNIDAIFISHPHEDHFSLLLKQLSSIKDSCQNFYLGGLSQDWLECCEICQLAGSDKLFDWSEFKSCSTSAGKKLIKAALKSGNASNYLESYASLLLDFSTSVYDPNNYIFCGEAVNCNVMTFLNDVTFEILKADNPKNSDNINQKSFLLKVTYDGKSILFTGDSEGESIDRHINLSNNITQSLKLMSIMHIDEAQQINEFLPNIKTQPYDQCSDFYNFIIEQNAELASIFEPIEPEKNIYELSTIKELREKITDSQLVFLPHHGSGKSEAQRFLGFFSTDGKKHCFVISSSSFGKDALPKRSNLEIAPNVPIHPEHPFVYARNASKTKSMMMTTKPIYVTGSEPGGVVCFRAVKEAKSIEKFDAFKREVQEQWRWFPITE